MASSVRSNPPMSIVSFDEVNQYRTLYDDITREGVTLQYVDRHALAELAITLCDMRMLRLELQDNGESMEVQGDRNKVTKKNPAREALQKLSPIMMKLFGEFKMTPNSRGKSSGQPIGGGSGISEQDDFDEI